MSTRLSVIDAITQFEDEEHVPPTHVEMQYGVFMELWRVGLEAEDEVTDNDAIVVAGTVVFPLLAVCAPWDFIVSGVTSHYHRVAFPGMAADVAEIYSTLRNDGMMPHAAAAAAERLA